MTMCEIEALGIGYIPAAVIDLYPAPNFNTVPTSGVIMKVTEIVNPNATKFDVSKADGMAVEASETHKTVALVAEMAMDDETERTHIILGERADNPVFAKHGGAGGAVRRPQPAPDRRNRRPASANAGGKRGDNTMTLSERIAAMAEHIGDGVPID